MAGRQRKQVKLSESELDALSARVRDAALQPSLALRLRIVLGSALGKSNAEIARELDVSERTVMKWRDRFASLGEAGLSDAPRPGAPRRINTASVAEVIARGLPDGRRRMSTRDAALRSGVSQSTVSRIWRASGLSSELRNDVQVVAADSPRARRAVSSPDESSARLLPGIAIDDDLKLAFYMAPVGLMVSRQRVVHSYNEAFCGMFGYSDGSLTGSSLELLYPSPKDFEHIGERALEIMRRTGVYSDERIMRRADESLFWCHVSGRAIDRNDPFAAAVWTFEDLSSVRRVTADLTVRERQIAQLMVNGKSSKQIAKELGISPRTVEGHRARLMRKYDVETTSELLARLVGRAI